MQEKRFSPLDREDTKKEAFTNNPLREGALELGSTLSILKKVTFTLLRFPSSPGREIPSPHLHRPSLFP